MTPADRPDGNGRLDPSILKIATSDQEVAARELARRSADAKSGTVRASISQLFLMPSSFQLTFPSVAG
jgi:hypothetical protein